ncbi:MAG: hypothetical protein LBU27_08890 [Candidatus Peribacteria bacterium]|jgi:hypothetical protein|nr:hypothetical protein [Candidatus Peribacteria bacterium]
MKKVDEKEVPVDTGATTSPYDSYTKKDLAEFLTKNEVALTGKENKQELIALIETNGLDIKAGSTDA